MSSEATSSEVTKSLCQAGLITIILPHVMNLIQTGMMITAGVIAGGYVRDIICCLWGS